MKIGPLRVGERLGLHDRLAGGNEKPVLLGQLPNLVHHKREHPMFKFTPQAVDFVSLVPPLNFTFSACVCGGIFAILAAVDALIVFLQLCGLFQVGWLDPQLPRKRVFTTTTAYEREK